MLCPDEPGQNRPAFDFYPKMIEGAIPVQGIAQSVRMMTGLKQGDVGLRVARDETHLAFGKAVEKSVDGSNFVPMLTKQLVELSESLNDLLRVIRSVDLFSQERRAILAAWYGDSFFRKMHGIRSGIFPLGQGDGAHLAGRVSHPAQIDAGIHGVPVDAEWQQTYALDRPARLACLLGRRNRAGIFELRVQ